METIELSPVDSPSAPAASAAPVETACTAELAECTCPDFCERDHEND